jgi:hypothetical protein
MTAPALPPEKSTGRAPDRVGIIRRSQRCFAFGLFGLVPFFGLGLGWRAIVLALQVAKECGEPISQSMKGSLVIVAGLFLIGALLVLDQSGLALAFGLLLAAFPGILLFREYHRTEPREWNPARHLVFWGAGLAQAGIVISATILLLIIDALMR